MYTSWYDVNLYQQPSFFCILLEFTVLISFICLNVLGHYRYIYKSMHAWNIGILLGIWGWTSMSVCWLDCQSTALVQPEIPQQILDWLQANFIDNEVPQRMNHNDRGDPLSWSVTMGLAFNKSILNTMRWFVLNLETFIVPRGLICFLFVLWCLSCTFFCPNWLMLAC